jgi:hypothetical protein
MNRFALSLVIPWFATAVSMECSADTLSTWIKRDSPITNNLSAIAFGNDTFVAVGSGYYPGGVVLSSPDGSNWIQRLSVEPASLHAVTYGNGQFIAVGSEGVALISTNGIDWLIHNTGFTNTLSGITYGKGMFVAVGGDVGRRNNPYDPGDHVILTSPDGMQWTLRDSGTNGLGAVAFGNGMFVAAGGYQLEMDYVGHSHSAILNSHDGIGWDRVPIDLRFTPNGVTFGAGRFMIVGTYSRGGAAGYVASSADGVDWVRRGLGYGLNGVAFGNDTFVAVGSYGLLFTSRNLTNWTTRRLEPNISLSHDLGGVTYGNGTFVAFSFTGLIVQSANVAIPWIQPLKRFGTGDVSLTIEGEIGRVYRLQASSDFIGWSDIGVVTNTTVEADFLDLNATGFNQRFYRVVSP